MPKLMLDGKEIGEISADGTVKGADGKSVKAERTVLEPNPDEYQVPLDHPMIYGRRGQPPTPQLEDEGGEDPPKKTPPAKEPTEADVALALENKILQRQVDALQRQNISAKISVDPQGQPAIDLGATIPADLDDEKDPYGVARAVKQIAGAVSGLNTKVNRLDQHAGFTEYNRALETEKLDYKDVFEDPKIGPIATRLLDAELQTNNTDPISVLVANVVKEVKGLGISTEKPKQVVKDKIKQKAEVPRTIRAGEGSPPTITVTRPKNIKEAREQYASWKSARNRAIRGS